VSALDVLLAGVPAELRGRAAGEVLDVLERGYGASGAATPAWLQALRARETEDRGG
jgi:hypothetical protein